MDGGRVCGSSRRLGRQDGGYFFVMESGVLEVVVDGVVANTLLATSSFGGIGLLYNCPRTATVSATAASGVWAADGSTFRRVIREWCTDRSAEPPPGETRILDTHTHRIPTT